MDVLRTSQRLEAHKEHALHRSRLLEDLLRKEDQQQPDALKDEQQRNSSKEDQRQRHERVRTPAKAPANEKDELQRDALKDEQQRNSKAFLSASYPPRSRSSHGARPVHLITTMINWIRTSRLPIKNSLSASQDVNIAGEGRGRGVARLDRQCPLPRGASPPRPLTPNTVALRARGRLVLHCTRCSHLTLASTANGLYRTDTVAPHPAD